jgi:hypothetical protein
MGVVPDDRRRLPDLVGGQVTAVRERAGVQGQDRQPVGEHVVHLARDPRPFHRTRTLQPVATLSFPPSFLRQREVPRAPQVQTEADQARDRHGGADRGDQGRHLPSGNGERGADEREPQHRAGPGDTPAVALGGERDESDGRGTRGRARPDREQGGHDRDGERQSSAPAEQDQADHAEAQVECALRPVADALRDDEPPAERGQHQGHRRDDVPQQLLPASKGFHRDRS